MSQYKRIIVGVALDFESDTAVIQQVKMLCHQFNTQATLVHAVEHMSSYGAAYGIAAGADIEDMLVDNARKAMSELGSKLEIPSELQIIKLGSPKLVLLEEANRMNADLIVVGSHGRHGMGLLLGSTANAVLHGAKCDVLSIRIKD